MTNTEVRTALNELRLSAESGLVIKATELTTETNALIERILTAPVAHAEEPGGNEADPQFVADLERLQAIAEVISAPFAFP